MDWSFEGDDSIMAEETGRGNAGSRPTIGNVTLGTHDDSGRGGATGGPPGGPVVQKGGEEVGNQPTGGGRHRAQPIMAGPGGAPTPAGSGAGLGVSIVAASNILGGLIASNVTDSVGLESELIARAVELTAKLEAAMLGAAGIEAPVAPEPRVKVRIGKSVVYMTEAEAAASGGQVLPDRRG